MWEAFQAAFGWLPHAELFTTGRLERVWNVVMFIPLGFGLVLLWPHWWWASVLLLASIAIEGVQYVFYRGVRLPEAWDIVTNALGGLIGVAAGFVVLWLCRSGDDGASTDDAPGRDDDAGSDSGAGRERT
ncbi:VanZ like protein [Brevibacterium sanguinis]|uniref:VanZ like protein n=2 Tax=Brevibacterium TaxID=1696 RepID=A0A366IEE8_9MICO|nr:VanZ like protein [Brevibacterium sanguinis]RBP69533.1 VanZ like protein [Brevibacterium celere]